MRKKSVWKGMLVLLLIGLMLFVIPEVEALKTRNATALTSVLHECALPRALPLFGSPFQQPIIENVLIKGRWIVYTVFPQPGFTQGDVVLFDAGQDQQLFTRDDGQATMVQGTHSVIISDIALAPAHLFWIQEQSQVNPLKEIKECSLPSCSQQSVIFAGDAQYSVEGHADAYAQRRAWTLGYASGYGYDLLMWCSHAQNGIAGGCLPADQKQVLQLGLNPNEYVIDLKTTTDHAYLLTGESTPQGAQRRITIVDYATANVTRYYDQRRDIILVEAIAAESVGNVDVLYMQYTPTISLDFIPASSAGSSFQQRTPLMFQGSVAAFALNMETSTGVNGVVLQRNQQTRTSALLHMGTQVSYALTDTFPQQRPSLTYNGKGYAALDQQGMPIYAACA